MPPMGGRGGRGPMRGPKPKVSKGTLLKLIKLLLKNYKWQLLIVILCFTVASTATASTGIFLKNVIESIYAKIITH